MVMSPRPAKVEDVLDIQMSYPRARAQDVFLSYRTKILNILNYGGNIPQEEFSI